MEKAMLTSTVLVQEPDYVGFRRVNLPLRVEGAVYDGLDPYATALGVIFLVAGEGRPREVYVPRERGEEDGKTVYRHDLDKARYVASRNGFERGQLHLTGDAPDDTARGFLRAFFEAQNTPAVNTRYLMQVNG